MSVTRRSLIAAFVAGTLCVFGFAPFGLFPVPVVALAVLFVLWRRAADAGTAAWLGFSFGLGLFVAGIGWIYIALHDYGYMPFPLAALATLLFAAVLALFPALAGYAQARLPAVNGVWFRSPEKDKRAPPQPSYEVLARVALPVLMPACWVLVEWLRGMIFTGFPWLTLGYAQSDSPLAGYAPILGVYGVSLVAAVSAGLLALFFEIRFPLPGRKEGRKDGRVILVVLLALWFAGVTLRAVEWTQPHGAPIRVALVQGNIGQGVKFDEGHLVSTLETYRRLAEQSEANLVVLPETALPLLREEVPAMWLHRLSERMRQNGGDMLIGVFDRDERGYYNAVFSLGTSEQQHYRKQHLVPFGEFIPLRYVLGPLINGVLDIPMGDLARGGTQQAVLAVAGQRVAANICYEDVFGEEIIRALPEATLLVNFTNDAWYGESHAAAQHNQISQLRALETGRMMLRATNTGLTSIIGVDGRVVQQLPQHTEGVLTGMAQGYKGTTPYVRMGNSAVMLLLIGMLGYAWLRRTTSLRPLAGED